MTEDEAVAKLDENTRSMDTEADHVAGDRIVSEFLRQAGFGRLADAYDEHKEGWWYA